MIAIRPATASDAETIAAIYVDSWNAGFEGLMPARRLTAELVVRWGRALAMPLPHRWWVAAVDDEIAGFAGIRPSRDPPDPTLGELDTIAMAPPWWRCGIGRALMTTALRHLQSDGYREAVLWTLANYARGGRFYEAMGWQLDGGVRDEGRQIRYRYRCPDASRV